MVGSSSPLLLATLEFLKQDHSNDMLSMVADYTLRPRIIERATSEYARKYLQSCYLRVITRTALSSLRHRLTLSDHIRGICISTNVNNVTAQRCGLLSYLDHHHEREPCTSVQRHLNLQRVDLSLHVLASCGRQAHSTLCPWLSLNFIRLVSPDQLFLRERIWSSSSRHARIRWLVQTH